MSPPHVGVGCCLCRFRGTGRPSEPIVLLLGGNFSSVYPLKDPFGQTHDGKRNPHKHDVLSVEDRPGKVSLEQHIGHLAAQDIHAEAMACRDT